MNSIGLLVGGPFDGQKIAVDMGVYRAARALVMREFKNFDYMEKADLVMPSDVKASWYVDHRYLITANVRATDALVVYRHELIPEEAVVMKLVVGYAELAEIKREVGNGRLWVLEA